MKRLRWLLLLGVVVFEVGCGLPDAYYLTPPVGGTTLFGSGIFTIIGTSRANDVNVFFRGYELYYKCYSAGTGDTSALLPDENYGSSSYAVSDLLQHGFLRVCRGPPQPPLGGGLAVDTSPGSGNAPLIDVKSIDSSNIGSNHTISISLSDPAAPTTFGFLTTFNSQTIPVSYFTYSPPGLAPTVGWEIRRFVQADPLLGQLCKPFTSNFYYGSSLSNPNWNAPDSDISAVYTTDTQASPNGLTFVMLYALSYGVGKDDTVRQSYPTWLGYTTIRIIGQ